MNWNELIVGIIVGIFCCYTYIRLSMLQRQLDTFPTPAQLAKEIINIKLPMSELPPEMQNRIAQANAPLPQATLMEEKPTYMG